MSYCEKNKHKDNNNNNNNTNKNIIIIILLISSERELLVYMAPEEWCCLCPFRAGLCLPSTTADPAEVNLIYTILRFFNERPLTAVATTVVCCTTSHCCSDSYGMLLISLYIPDYDWMRGVDIYEAHRSAGGLSRPLRSLTRKEINGECSG